MDREFSHTSRLNIRFKTYKLMAVFILEYASSSIKRAIVTTWLYMSYFTECKATKARFSRLALKYFCPKLKRNAKSLVIRIFLADNALFLSRKTGNNDCSLNVEDLLELNLAPCASREAQEFL